MSTNTTQPGGFVGDPAAALSPPTSAGGCCGSPATTTTTDSAPASTCCGTVTEAKAEAGCGSAANEQPTAASAGCCG